MAWPSKVERASMAKLEKALDTRGIRRRCYQALYADETWTERNRRRRYGITRDQFNAALDAHGGGCGICGKWLDRKAPRKTHVDHDHKTGRVRGVLCMQCNTSLGWFERLAERIAAYLETG